MRPDPSLQSSDAPIGRAREAAILRGLVDAPGAGRVALIFGEGGIGKTTLVDHLVAGVVADGAHVLRGAADERDTARFSLWRRVLRDLGVALPHGDPSVGVADQVDELAAVVGDALETGAWRLVVLEDLHWADEASLDLMRIVGERLAGRPVLVVGSVRQGECRSRSLVRLRSRSELIVLGGLTVGEVAEVAARMKGDVPTSQEATILHRMTGGNPLFVRELLALDGNPSSVAENDLLKLAIEGLGDPAVHVLSVFALAGRETPITGLARACSLSIDQVEAALERGLRAQVLSSDVGRPWFRHDLLAAAASSRLSPGARAEVHRALAEHWRAAARGDDERLEEARHWLGAVPSVGADAAAAAVIAIATQLRRRRRAGDAADLLERARLVLTDLPPPLMSSVWMELGEARWDLADRPAALDSFERASAGASGDDLDIETTAAIEVARQRHHNPFIPDPGARDRLADLDRELGAGDSALRSALLGRRAMLALQPPARQEEATGLADQAVAVARRVGDPEALLQALCDRAFVVGSADDLRGRGAVAEEVLDLARAAGRPDLALAGHEWRCDDQLLRGDMQAAREVLEELEALAVVAPSPAWRCSALLRRASLLLAEGDRVGAIDAIEATAQLAAGLLDPFEHVGIEMAIRGPAVVLYGTPDPRFSELHADFRSEFDAVPSTFMQVRIALGDLLTGARETAEHRASGWLARPQTAFEAPDALGTLAIMAFLADEVLLADAAPGIVDALTPFRGLICAAMSVPVEMLLAQMHLLIGDVDSGTSLAEASLHRARVLGSPVAEAHCLRVVADAQRARGDLAAAGAATAAAEGFAERLGLDLEPAWSRRAASSSRGATSIRAPAVPQTVRLSRSGDVWTIESSGHSVSLPHLAGLTQLALLLAVPGLEVPATDLAGGSTAPEPDLGPALDARAKRDYRRRINELQSEIDEAQSWADPERADAARRELEALIAELRRAVGLSGRDRPQGSGRERARINAARNIRRAITAIGKVAPDLAAHLNVSICTGHHCSYSPDPAVRIHWLVER